MRPKIKLIEEIIEKVAQIVRKSSNLWDKGCILLRFYIKS